MPFISLLLSSAEFIVPLLRLFNIVVFYPDTVHFLTTLFIALKSCGVGFFYLNILLSVQFNELA